jgi:hypothetical protein
LDPQTALIVAVTAAVLGQVLGASLTVVGGLVNDYLSSRREERREQREIHAHREQWEREDRVRKDREDRERSLQGAVARGAAYRGFMDVTSAPDRLSNSPNLVAYLASLDRAYMDVLLVCTDHVRSPAEDVYETSRQLAIEDDEDKQDEMLETLDHARSTYFSAVRKELDGLPYESRITPAGSNPTE